MVKTILDTIKSFFSPKQLDKSLVTPNWHQQGNLARAKIQKLPDDELSQQRAIENTFSQIYEQHNLVCKQNKLPPALRPIALQNFMKGWNESDIE